MLRDRARVDVMSLLGAHRFLAGRLSQSCLPVILLKIQATIPFSVVATPVIRYIYVCSALSGFVMSYSYGFEDKRSPSTSSPPLGVNALGNLCLASRAGRCFTVAPDLLHLASSASLSQTKSVSNRANIDRPALPYMSGTLTLLLPRDLQTAIRIHVGESARIKMGVPPLKLGIDLERQLDINPDT